MNKKLLIFFSIFLFSMCLDASAQFVFGDHVIKVLDLPNTPEYLEPSDQNFGSPKYLDLGIAHKQFCFVLPVWNYGEPEYVLYREKWPGEHGADYFTYVLDDEQIATFHELYGIPLTPQIPFWDKWGGKLVLLLLLVLFFVWDSKR